MVRGMIDDSLDWFIPLHQFLMNRVLCAPGGEFAGDYDYEDLAHAERRWATFIHLSSADSDDPYWANGKHMGDCTKEPITCNTCLIESTRMEAKYVFEFLKKLAYKGYPDEIYVAT